MKKVFKGIICFFAISLLFVDLAKAVVCKRLVVQKGETIHSIANDYTGNPEGWKGFMIEKTSSGNKWINSKEIKAGDEIWLVKSKIKSYPYTSHQIRKNETLHSIAKYYTGNSNDWKELLLKDGKWIDPTGFSSLKPGDIVKVVDLKNFRRRPVPGVRFVKQSFDSSHTVPEKTTPLPRKKPLQSPPPSKRDSQTFEESIVRAKNPPRVIKPSKPLAKDPPKSGNSIKFNNRALYSIDASLWGHYQTNLHSKRKKEGTGWGGQLDFTPILAEINGQLVKLGPVGKINEGSVKVSGNTYEWDSKSIGVFGETDFDARTLRAQLFLTKLNTGKREGNKSNVKLFETEMSWEDKTGHQDPWGAEEGSRYLTAYKITAAHREPLGGNKKDRHTEIKGRVALVDLKLTEQDRLSLEAAGILGKSTGKDSLFGGIGAGVSLGSMGKHATDYLRITVLPIEYFSNKDASVLKVLGFVNPDGVFRRIQAAGVEETKNSAPQK